MNALTTLAGTMIGRQRKGLVALALCPILLAGCAGTGLQSSGLAGPSWQQREALYLQEEEEGDLGDRLGEAAEKAAEERNRQRRKLYWILLLAGAVVGYLYLGDDDEDEDYVSTFEDPAVSTTKSPPRENRRWQETVETAAMYRGILPQLAGVAPRGRPRRGSGPEGNGAALESSLTTVVGGTDAPTQDNGPSRLGDDRSGGSREKARSR